VAASCSPRKILEAYLASFSDDAGGPDDERDHEDFDIADALAERLASLGKAYLGRRGPCHGHRVG
jgi:hypothetical protein